MKSVLLSLKPFLFHDNENGTEKGNARALLHLIFFLLYYSKSYYNCNKFMQSCSVTPMSVPFMVTTRMISDRL